MGFSRQEYWSGLLFPPSGDLPDPGIEPTSLRSPALAGRFFTTRAAWEVPLLQYLGEIEEQARALEKAPWGPWAGTFCTGCV